MRPEPAPGATGLVRIYCGPQEVIAYMKSLIKSIKFLVAPMTALAVMAGCSKNPQSAQENFGSTADRAAIQSTIQQDDLFNMQGIDDDGPQSPSYESNLGKIAEFIETLRWGRRGVLRLESVDVEFTSDTTAEATIIHSLNGKFHILAKDTSDTNAVGTLYTKDMANTILRKAKLIKVRNTGIDRRDWRVNAVSGCVATSPSPTISITELAVEQPNGSTLTITDPLAFFISRDTGLPQYNRGDSVKIFVKLTNTNNFPPAPGETVLVRHGMDHRFHRARKPLNDEGIYPDVTAGDGTYSGIYRIGPRPGLHHGGIDAIDNGTIYDNVAPYNAVVWSLPYLVKL